MKKYLLKITVFLTISAPLFNINNFNLVKLQNLRQKFQSFDQLSPTTGVFHQKNTDEMFIFDATKRKEITNGLIKLNYKINKIRILTTNIGIFHEKNTNLSYFIDFTRFNDPNGVINLEINLVGFNKISETLWIVVEQQSYNNYLLDLSKVDEPNKGLTMIKKISVQKLSSTKMLVEPANDPNNSYLLDLTKINKFDQSLINLRIKMHNFISFSENIFILITISGKIFLIDTTKINKSCQQMIEFHSEVLGINKLSSTTGILIEKNNDTYFFDLTKNPEDMKICLNKKFNFQHYADTFSETNIVLTEFYTNQIYLFDATKINQQNKGLINLEKKSDNCCRFIILTKTTALFHEEKTENKYNLFFLNLIEINQPNKGFIKLGNFYFAKKLCDSLIILCKYDLNEFYIFDTFKIYQPKRGLLKIDLKNNTMFDIYKLSDISAIFIESKFFLQNNVKKANKDLLAGKKAADKELSRAQEALDNFTGETYFFVYS